MIRRAPTSSLANFGNPRTARNLLPAARSTQIGGGHLLPATTDRIFRSERCTSSRSSSDDPLATNLLPGWPWGSRPGQPATSSLRRSPIQIGGGHLLPAATDLPHTGAAPPPAATPDSPMLQPPPCSLGDRCSSDLLPRVFIPEKGDAHLLPRIAFLVSRGCRVLIASGTMDRALPCGFPASTHELNRPPR